MIHLEVVVANTTDLLAPEAYDAGALLRWESSDAVDGIYAEGGTLALVADISLYDIWDAAGLVTTWYRTRISDAGGTTFSAYSSPFQTAVHSLYLSVAQFRAFNPSPSLTNEALLILLDAASQAIVSAVGPSGEVNEILNSHGDLVMLSRPALSITSVSEGHWSPVTLSADDYELRSSGQTLRRLRSGTNPSWGWRGRVDVTYVPRDDIAERQRVQRELVMLELSNQPGLVSQTIGTFSESFSSSQAKSYAEQRADILASLDSGGGII